MSIETAVVVKQIESALKGLGLNSRVEIDVLDAEGPALFITVVSDDFDGQAHLDRELHIRPAVIRALHAQGLIRATTIIEPLTTEERTLRDRVSTPQGTLELDSSDEERIGKQLWRERKARVLTALSTVYNIDEVDANTYIASRNSLGDERIAIGFAPAPRATTVELSIRASFQTAKNSQKIRSFFYLSPSRLSAPFSNQTQARWIECLTDIEFLHRINSSADLSTTQAARIEQDFRGRPSDERGPVISPDVRTLDENLRLEPFFDFVRSWSKEERASLLILMAPAGHGKTTLTKELSRQLSIEFLANQATASVPLLVPFEEVRRTVDFDALMHKKFAELKAGTFGAFKELLFANSAILVVDGFDELADDAGFVAAENQIRSMRPLLSGNSKVILAGRSVFTQEFGGDEGIVDRVRGLLGDIDVQTLEILPFEEKKVREYVMSREGLDPSQKQAVLDFSQLNSDTEHLASNPLFLRILCSLAHAGGNPVKEGAVGSIDSLIEQVCEREEVRQNLGIGIERQIRFLEDLAIEAVGRGGAYLPASDVRIIAKLICEEINAAESVVEKLVDHAFLTTSSAGRCAFIHPLVRDVLAGRSIVVAIRDRVANVWEGVLSKRDLPFGTTQYVARALAERPGLSLPSRWTAIATVPSQTRRNLFRFSAERVRYQKYGDPREWRGPEVSEETSIVDLDLSRLVLDGLSLDGLTLSRCDLSESLVEDCDMRRTQFRECDLYGATFIECRADQFLSFYESSLAGVEVRIGSKLRQPSSAIELQTAMQTQTSPGGKAAPAKISAAAIRDFSVRLLERALTLLVAPDGTKFFEIGDEEFRFDNDPPADRNALEKVVVPLVVTKLCQTILEKKSRQIHSIAKHWKRPIGNFVQTGQTTPAIDELLNRIGQKAARYLEPVSF